MDKARLESVLDSFFENKTQKILVLKGGWGVGKTYFWEGYIKNKIENEGFVRSCKAYCYSSLFGIHDLSSLQEKIITHTEVIDESVVESMLQKTGVNGKGLLGLIAKIPLIKDKFYDATPFLHNMIRDQIICFDDLERCHKDFSIKTLMGYADELVQKRNCKIVIIFNEEQLDLEKKEVFNRYREKIVDIEVSYTPHMETNFDIVFNGLSLDDDWKDIIYQRCLLLNIDNIRVLKKIRYAIECYRSKMVENFFPITVRNMFLERMISLMKLYLEEKQDSYLKVKTGVFTNQIKISGAYSEMVTFLGDKEVSNDGHTLISQVLNKYHLNSSFIFDDEIIFYINNGFISPDFMSRIFESDMQQQILKREERRIEYQNKISDIFAYYHCTFQDNMDNIIVKLNSLVSDDELFEYLDIADFSKFIKTFYFFNKLKDSTYKAIAVFHYIDTYFTHHKDGLGEKSKEEVMFEIKSPFDQKGDYDSIDEYFGSKLADLVSEMYQELSLWEILKKTNSDGFFSKEEYRILDNATKEEYRELFRVQESPNFLAIIRNLYRELESRGTVGTLDAVLGEISVSNPLNEQRVNIVKNIH